MADRLTLPEPGDVIAGKYRIDCAIGSGGMGAVYQVTHRVTGKRFALKWLLPQVSAHGDAAQRFIREAQVAGRFEHPNVVEVYDVGSEGDSFYMVMELLEGESLGERVDRAGPLSVTETCELLIPCMRGVAEAHGAGIVHRDLKPANIFICKTVRQEPERGKVLDFGISKMSGAPGGELGGGMTKSGTLIGTPHYMPLEQMRGKAVDHRADIYALGVVLYQVLSGNLPYPADSFSDLVLMLAHETPKPLDRVVPQLPRGLAQVVARAMAREAADRYQSIDELIAALEPYADGRASLSSYTPSGRRSLDSSLSLPTPLSTESRVSARPSAYSRPPPSRAPWIAGIGAFLILAIVAGALWLRRERLNVEVARPNAVQPSVLPTSSTTQAAAPEAPARAAAARPEAAEEQMPKLDIVRTVPEAATGSASAGQLVPSPELARPVTPAAVGGSAPPRSAAAVARPAATPIAATHPAAPRVTPPRVQPQRLAPPAPEPAEPVKKPEPQRDTRLKPPSSRVPAISEGDFY